MTPKMKDDVLLMVCSLLTAVAGLVSTFTGCRVLAWIVIAIVNLYLCTVLLFASLLCDCPTMRSKPCLMHFFPTRTAGLIMVLLLLLSNISGFAGLYVGLGVFPSNKTPLDALYISCFTLGFGEYGPNSGYGQLVVLAQFASGILLLLGAFPLLISRISNFES